MAHTNRLSRGDVRRNARLDRLRRVVSRDHAVLAVDLADDTQVVVVCDHDSRVLARRTWRCRPWQLDRALQWGQATACRLGFAGVVVACEPTGHRWRVVVEQASGLGAVCVQPLLVHRARESEDFTRDKSDNKDALEADFQPCSYGFGLDLVDSAVRGVDAGMRGPDPAFVRPDEVVALSSSWVPRRLRRCRESASQVTG
jgi:hypothetical protein